MGLLSARHDQQLLPINGGTTVLAEGGVGENGQFVTTSETLGLGNIDGYCQHDGCRALICYQCNRSPDA